MQQKKLHKSRRLLSILSVSLLSLIIQKGYAQVTIGSEVEANPGIILDLKENESKEENAEKGLGLPRVYLEDKAFLYPMLKDKADYVNGSTKIQDEKIHTGLTVYNLTTDLTKDLCEGVYVWKGNKWNRLFKACPLPYCGYDIESNKTPGKIYTFYCKDFSDLQQNAKQICKDGFQDGADGASYHLFTYDEFMETWNKNTSHFPLGSSYYVDYNGWITLGIINADGTHVVLGDMKPYPGGAPIGGLLPEKHIVRCVKD